MLSGCISATRWAEAHLRIVRTCAEGSIGTGSPPPPLTRNCVMSQDDDHVYLVQDYCTGGSVEDLLQV